VLYHRHCAAVQGLGRENLPPQPLTAPLFLTAPTFCPLPCPVRWSHMLKPGHTWATPCKGAGLLRGWAHLVAPGHTCGGSGSGGGWVQGDRPHPPSLPPYGQLPAASRGQVRQNLDPCGPHRVTLRGVAPYPAAAATAALSVAARRLPQPSAPTAPTAQQPQPQKYPSPL